MQGWITIIVRPRIPSEINIVVLTAVVVPISVIVTFLTPAVSKEKLEESYRRVRPGDFSNCRMGILLPML